MSSRRAANFDGDQSMNTKSVPTLYEWAGGMASLERLTNHFYERVRQDEMLSPVFPQMHGEHPRFVAQFLAEVLGGPAVSRIAVINSQPGETVESSAPMPPWGWGEVGGPYQP
jgi:Bacterial-like globin